MVSQPLPIRLASGIVSLPAVPSDVAGLGGLVTLVGGRGNGLWLKAFRLLANKVTCSGMEAEEVRRSDNSLPTCLPPAAIS